jgi:hypothetical protein
LKQKQLATTQQDSLAIDRLGEYQVFYPRPFAQLPHLQFGRTVDFNVKEQTAAGFKIEVSRISGPGSKLDWRAIGIAAVP